MPRQSSIPSDLEPALLRRWVEGTSPRALHRWIEESNATRKTPIVTSVSSVLRCLERAATRNSSLACLASVHRARLRSSALMDTLEEVDDGYRAVVTAAKGSAREFPNHQIAARLKALGKLELSTHRQLKLAGVGTAFGHKLAEDHKAIAHEMSRDIAAEDDLEDHGLPPEITVRHFPPELLPPAPLTHEIMTALRREHARPRTNLSESEPLVSQLIDESNRITSKAPSTAASSTSSSPTPHASTETRSSLSVQAMPASAPSVTEVTPSLAASGTALSESSPLVSQTIAGPNRITTQGPDDAAPTSRRSNGVARSTIAEPGSSTGERR